MLQNTMFNENPLLFGTARDDQQLFLSFKDYVSCTYGPVYSELEQFDHFVTHVSREIHEILTEDYYFMSGDGALLDYGNDLEEMTKLELMEQRTILFQQHPESYKSYVGGKRKVRSLKIQEAVEFYSTYLEMEGVHSLVSSQFGLICKVDSEGCTSVIEFEEFMLGVATTIKRLEKKKVYDDASLSIADIAFRAGVFIVAGFGYSKYTRGVLDVAVIRQAMVSAMFMSEIAASRVEEANKKLQKRKFDKKVEELSESDGLTKSLNDLEKIVRIVAPKFGEASVEVFGDRISPVTLLRSLKELSPANSYCRTASAATYALDAYRKMYEIPHKFVFVNSSDPMLGGSSTVPIEISNLGLISNPDLKDNVLISFLTGSSPLLKQVGKETFFELLYRLALDGYEKGHFIFSVENSGSLSIHGLSHEYADFIMLADFFGVYCVYVDFRLMRGCEGFDLGLPLVTSGILSSKFIRSMAATLFKMYLNDADRLFNSKSEREFLFLNPEQKGILDGIDNILYLKLPGTSASLMSADQVTEEFDYDELIKGSIMPSRFGTRAQERPVDDYELEGSGQASLDPEDGGEYREHAVSGVHPDFS